ncbi:hypothetical protein JHK85_048658 [Glycine max]|nr:hypothetical protein JHK85_048658 [Glycine max]
MLPTGKVTAFNLCHFFSKTDPHAFYDAMDFLSVHYDSKLDLDALTLRGGRQKCLQSLHAFKGDNDPHLHFEDKNVFNHCILSKATMNLICISKTIMSSVISCLQRRQYKNFLRINFVNCGSPLSTMEHIITYVDQAE